MSVNLLFTSIEAETEKAILFSFNIENRINYHFAVCYDLGNSMTYPMSNNPKIRKQSIQFRSDYSKKTNLYQATKNINFMIWLPKSKCKIVEENKINVPDWLWSKIGQLPFCSKEQTAPEEFATYPYHCTLLFHQVAQDFFITEKFFESSSSRSRNDQQSYDDPWSEYGIGSHDMQDFM